MLAGKQFVTRVPSFYVQWRCWSIWNMIYHW